MFFFSLFTRWLTYIHLLFIFKCFFLTYLQRDRACKVCDGTWLWIGWCPGTVQPPRTSSPPGCLRGPLGLLVPSQQFSVRPLGPAETHSPWRDQTWEVKRTQIQTVGRMTDTSTTAGIRPVTFFFSFCLFFCMFSSPFRISFFIFFCPLDSSSSSFFRPSIFPFLPVLLFLSLPTSSLLPPLRLSRYANIHIF